MATVECVYFRESEGVALTIHLYYNGIIDYSLATVKGGVTETVSKWSELTSQRLNVIHQSSIRNGVPDIEVEGTVRRG